MAARLFSTGNDWRRLFRYADEVCRQGMPTGYADRVCRQAVPTGCHRDPIRDNEKIQPPLQMVQKCPPEGMPTTYADTPMPTTYADDLCRHPMPTTYADNLCRHALIITSLASTTLIVSRPYIYIYISIQMFLCKSGGLALVCARLQLSCSGVKKPRVFS